MIILLFNIIYDVLIAVALIVSTTMYHLVDDVIVNEKLIHLSDKMDKLEKTSKFKG